MAEINVEDLPIRTIFKLKNGPTTWQKTREPNIVVCIRCDYGDEYSFESNQYMRPINAFDDISWTIIQPYGYQTPLWKVLNGEKIEGEE